MLKGLTRNFFELLDQEKVENGLTSCLVRNDEIFESIGTIEEKLIEKKETPIKADSLESISKDTDK